jgi:hypothetical protein
LELFGKLQLKPCAFTHDVANVRSVQVNSRWAIFDTNRYSVPAHLAGQTLTLKIYPDRLSFIYQNQQVARIPVLRPSPDIGHPITCFPLAQRQKAREQRLSTACLCASPPT